MANWLFYFFKLSFYCRSLAGDFFSLNKSLHRRNIAGREPVGVPVHDVIIQLLLLTEELEAQLAAELYCTVHVSKLDHRVKCKNMINDLCRILPKEDSISAGPTFHPPEVLW